MTITAEVFDPYQKTENQLSSYALFATTITALSALDENKQPSSEDIYFADKETPGMVAILPAQAVKNGTGRRGARDKFFDLLGVDVSDFQIQVFDNDKAGKKGSGPIRNNFHLFSSGGGLGTGTSTAEAPQIAHFRQWWPLLSLLGFSDKTMFESKINFGRGLPAAKSLAHLLPEQVHDRLTDLDPTALIGHGRQHFRHPERHLIPTEDKDRTMPWDLAYVPPGVTFVLLVTPKKGITTMELSTLGFFLEALKERSIVGGRSSMGHGKVNWEIPDSNDYPELNPTLFTDFVKEYKEQLLAAMFDPKGIWEATMKLPRLGRFGV